MAYGANILKTEAAYYSLQNATILGGVLHLNAGGSATQQITISDLPVITDTLQFTCISDNYSDEYDPDITVLVHARMTESQEYYNAVLFPVRVEPNRYICEFTLAAGEYDEMYVTLSAKKAVNMTLWEIAAIAADDDIETIIDGVKQSLPRLLYDYNTFPFDFDQAETTVAVITCRLLQNTDLQGHFLMTFLASQTATLTLRFYDNEAEELFAPLLYDVKVGYNSIGVPHAYMSRLAGVHTFVVTAQIAAGSCHIDTRKILYTIDGGYLAVRELDIGMDVTDIAIRQLASDNGPDQIWVVGLDAGEALVRYRDYKETNANVGWTAVGSLGRARSAAIEFNGTWVLRTGANQFTLNTEEEPWYFWVDDPLTLYACHGLPLDDMSNVIELATMVVSDVKAVRGYSSSTYRENDQGLLVVYIKNDGRVYYRSYSYNAAAHGVVWEEEVSLSVARYAYTSVNIHRLNDYRIGIELSGERGNYWIISDRTYVGQSAYPELFDSLHLDIDLDKGTQLFNYLPYDYNGPTPRIVDQGTYTKDVKDIYSTNELHYFVYDYSSDTKGNDLGPIEEIEGEYGKPIADQAGYLYLVIDGKNVYVKKFEVEVYEQQTKTYYTFWFKLDYAIWADDSYAMIDRILFNNSLEYLTDVNFEISGDNTIISITTDKAPSKLITVLTLRAATAYRLYDYAYTIIYPFYADIVATYDTTVYIKHTQSEELRSISSSLNIQYIPIAYPRHAQSDSMEVLSNSSIDINYRLAEFINGAGQDSMTSLQSSGITVEYTYVGDDPI